MGRQLTGHMRHNVVAYLALFIALGGTSAWAAGQITGNQIKDESLTGADVLNNSLKGDDVLESSLGAVPSATKAGDAGTLDTKTLSQVRSGIDADKIDGLESAALEGPRAYAGSAPTAARVQCAQSK